MPYAFSHTLLIKPFHRSVLRAGLVALGLSGLLTGGALLNSTTLAAAEPVRVEGVALADFSGVVEQVRPAVVSVKVETERLDQTRSSERFMPPEFRDLPENHPFRRFFERRFGQPDGEQTPNPERRRFGLSQGSGFFISEDGLIVTNEHVVRGGTGFTIVMDDGSEFEARLVGADRRTDLALLKVEEKRKFTYVAFADTPPQVGQWVVAVGNPFGLGGTVTAGIVSADGRDIGAGPYDDFIQIDAPVNRGNSGGPAFNLKGEVIGVNAAIFSPSGGNVGIAFAIPSSTAKVVIADLQDDGAVERGWLGVQIQPITPDIAESLGLDEARGALVSEAQTDSPAARAGIRAGDAILAVEGEQVEDPRALARMIAEYAPGSRVEVSLWRDGKMRSLPVMLGDLATLDRQAGLEGELEPAPAQPTALEELGLTLEGEENRVLITKVETDSPAERKGLLRGDVVLKADGQSVQTVDDVLQALGQVKKDGRKAVLLQVQNRQGVRFVAVPFADA